MAPKPVIYIVDDDDAVRDSLSVLLSLEGLAVRSYACGQDLLDDLPDGRAETPRGCVVTDVHMPQMKIGRAHV